MAWRKVRNVFWFTPEQPHDFKERAAHAEDLFEEVRAERQRTSAERAARPSVNDVFAGRSVLVTGGSGFMGRVLLEQLLRKCPDVARLYIILRAKKGVAPQDRLQDLTAVPLFDRLRAERPGALDKIVVLPGDTTALGLGLSDEHRALVQREVAFVFHLAASVRFDDPFQKAVFTNLRSAREVVELARGMVGLCAVVHVSTAYTNTNRDPVENVVYQPEQDWRDVIAWAEKLDEDSVVAANNLGPLLMGFQPNSYLFTKALAEKLMDDASRELPIVITRPSIIAPTSNEPLPGWVDNLYGLAGFWVAAMKGMYRVDYGPVTRFDCLPADFGCKILVLAAWSRALGLRLCPGEGVDVVTICAGLKLGTTMEEMGYSLSEECAGRAVPYPGCVRVPRLSITNCKVWYQMQHWCSHLLFGAVMSVVERAAGRRPRALKVYRLLVTTMNAIWPVRGPFDFRPEAMWKLQGLLGPRDEKEFGFKFGEFATRYRSMENYRDTVVDALRGVLVHTLKEKDDPVENRRAQDRVKWVMRFYRLAVVALLYLLVVGFFKLKASVRRLPEDGVDLDQDVDLDDETLYPPLWSQVFNTSELRATTST